ncbi:MAG TPA: PssE/Cps14G family polysaccharide biosynthesis glycosyltransferase [Bacillales bacterium]|nr:PssE/Cps14G family polysaccharide biosynthesis glycosyltransferase [Bacillales bacterium]
MILVVLGTHELPFTRMLKEIEKCKQNGIVEDDIFVQLGHTPFHSEVMNLVKFVSYEEMDRLYDKARLILTHGGTGSIISGLKKGKKIIAAARLKKYGEHNDDHQLELINQFVNANYILEWREEEPLADVIREVEDFTPEPFQSGKEEMVRLLRDFIEKD